MSNESNESIISVKPRNTQKLRVQLGHLEKYQKQLKAPKNLKNSVPPKRLGSESTRVNLDFDNTIFSARARSVFDGLDLGRHVRVTEHMIRTMQNIVGPQTDPLSRCGGCNRKDCAHCSSHEVVSSPACSSPGGMSFNAILESSK